MVELRVHRLLMIQPQTRLGTASQSLSANTKAGIDELEIVSFSVPVHISGLEAAVKRWRERWQCKFTNRHLLQSIREQQEIVTLSTVML
jgi:hypothetical protein